MSWKTLPRSDPSPGCKDAVIGARLDDELYGLLRSQGACDVHRSILIETFFSPISPMAPRGGLPRSVILPTRASFLRVA
jgi:hypothetical protein